MKQRMRLGMTLVFVSILNACSGSAEKANPKSDPEGMISVVGTARFGSQCPFGSYSQPRPVSIGLFSCPIGRSSIELEEPLQPIILQVDCKKMTIDVRNERTTGQPSTWEMMPDGSFTLTVNGGEAKLREDATGHRNCVTPLRVDMWGRVDCTDRDKAVIRSETLWWIGQTVETQPRPTSSPGPAPTAAPVPGPSPSPNSGRGLGIRASDPLPAAPGPTPSPAPSAEPSPSPIPTVPTVPTSVPTTPPANVQCVMPSGCYFHAITQIDQCS